MTQPSLQKYEQFFDSEDGFEAWVEDIWRVPSSIEASAAIASSEVPKPADNHDVTK